METRSQTRVKEGRSPSSPVSVLESTVPRPSSRSSESEGDLGLTTLLDDGDALVVGRGRAMESATSGPCDATIVAEQVPAREPVIVSSHLQLTVVDSAPTQVVTSATTLLGQRAQIPTTVSTTLAYSLGQIIKSVCVCQCVCVCVCLPVCPSASTLTVAFLDRFLPKLAQTAQT